jgi:excisionase family DNA binding protein
MRSHVACYSNAVIIPLGVEGTQEQYVGMANTRNLLTVNDVAQMTGWKPKTVRMKVWRRELEFVKLGRSVRFREETINRLIDRSTVPALERQ